MNQSAFQSLYQGVMSGAIDPFKARAQMERLKQLQSETRSKFGSFGKFGYDSSIEGTTTYNGGPSATTASTGYMTGRDPYATPMYPLPAPSYSQYSPMTSYRGYSSYSSPLSSSQFSTPRFPMMG